MNGLHISEVLAEPFIYLLLYVFLTLSPENILPMVIM